MNVNRMEYIPRDLTVTEVILSRNKYYEYDGYFYNEYDGSYVKFHSLLQLLKELDNLFDRFTFPQVTHEYRTFYDSKNKKERESEERIMAKSSNKGEESVKNTTFLLQVKFRRNASWQGQIQWIDKNITKNFRSTLELIRLIDNAVEQNGEPAIWDAPPQDKDET